MYGEWTVGEEIHCAAAHTISTHDHVVVGQVHFSYDHRVRRQYKILVLQPDRAQSAGKNLHSQVKDFDACVRDTSDLLKEQTFTNVPQVTWRRGVTNHIHEELHSPLT